MNNFLFYENKQAIPEEIINGNVYYTKDNKIYVDESESRKELALSEFAFKIEDFFLRLNNIEEEEQPKIYSFAFLSDTHSSSAYTNLVQQIKNKNVSLLIHCGDYVNYGTASELRTQVNNYRDSSYEYLITRGNHDGTLDNSYKKFLSESEVLSAMGKNPPYYYYDVPEVKLRFIVLNAHDRDTNFTITNDPQHYYGYSLEQMKWLCGTALQVSEPGWSAILISHTPIAPLEQMEGWSGTLYNEKYGGGIGRWYIASKVIEACNNGTVLNYPYKEGNLGNNAMNYSFNGNIKIIAALCGHVHADNILKVNGVPNISIEATIENPCFDYVTIDFNSKSITLDRYNQNGAKTSSRTSSWELPNGQNVGEEFIGTFDYIIYNCIVFDKISGDKFGLKYISLDRTSANNQRYLDDVSNKVMLSIELNENDTVTFSNGLLNNFTGSYVTRAIDNNTYKIYFQDGYYTGWSSITETSVSNPPVGATSDFFGVPDNIYQYLS